MCCSFSCNTSAALILERFLYSNSSNKYSGQKVNSSNKKFKCPHCEQTSNKKSNIQIHIQRKHKKQMVYDKYGSQVYQKGLSQNTESMSTDVKNSFQQHSSLFYYSQFIL